MTPADHAKSDATALLGGLTYMLRRLTTHHGNRMLDRMEMDECIALARWMDEFPIEPDPVEVRSFRDASWYVFANGLKKANK